MKKIIIIILSILLVGGIGVFLFLKFSNVSDDIEVDTIQETVEENVANENNIEETVSDKEWEKRKEKVLKEIQKEKKEKPLTPTEKYYQKYKKDLEKNLGSNSREIGLAKNNFPEIIHDIFVNNNWNKGLSEVECFEEHKIYYPKYLSQKFIDKYSEKGLAKGLNIDGKITLASFLPEPEGIYIKLSINYDEKIIYLIVTMTKDYKIEDVEIEAIIDNTVNDEVVFLNRYTYFDGILNYCLGENYNTTNKYIIDTSDDLSIEDKGNNKLNEKLYQYLGTWENEEGFYCSFEDKFINISIGIEEDGKDYEEKYTITFDYDEGKLTDLKFLIQKKKFLGNTDNREKRDEEYLEELERKQVRNDFRFSKDLEKEKAFNEELAKRFKEIENEEKVKERNKNNEK